MSIDGVDFNNIEYAKPINILLFQIIFNSNNFKLHLYYSF